MYRVKKIEYAYPIWVRRFLKLRKNNSKSNEKVDTLELFDKAVADAKEREAEQQRELRRRTEEVAKMFQDKTIELLKDYENTRNPIIEGARKNFGEYGYAQKAHCGIDDEKFEVVYDFSDKYHTRDVRMTLNRCNPYTNDYIPHYPREFAYGTSISWEYLESILENQNIKISRKQEKKVEKISLEDSLVTTKDIITVTVGRKNIKDKTPVISEPEAVTSEAPQKTKKKKNKFSIFFN